jgi:hypothetical protein
MNVVWQYNNFQYNGIASLKPNRGEIALYLAQYPDAAQSIHFVAILNANVTTEMNATIVMTGTGPAPIELYDDPYPSDIWNWTAANTSGSVRWTTQPTYTDGCVIGPLTFTENYCISGTLKQPNNAISIISAFTGTYTNVSRAFSAPYTNGAAFQFCQYPQTLTITQNVSCPGRSDGSAGISVVFGPQQNIFRWYNGSVVIGSSANITGLSAGTYTAAVNDTNIAGCNAIRTVVIGQPTLYAPSVTANPFMCPGGGSASATPNGGAAGAFTYQWMQGGAVVGTGSSVSGLAVGAASVQITDSCGSQTTTSFTIVTPGCCGDGVCQANEACGMSGSCPQDCGICCGAGTYITGTTCTPCAAGTSSTAIGATSCPQCAANTFNAGGSDPCVSCANNTFSAAGSGVCMPCSCGQIRGSTDSACYACGAGLIPNTATSTCVACAPGTYTAASGASACQACAPGTYSATAGSTGCMACSSGTYAPAGAASCSSCPTGTATPAATC